MVRNVWRGKKPHTHISVEPINEDLLHSELNRGNNLSADDLRGEKTILTQYLFVFKCMNG